MTRGACPGAAGTEVSINRGRCCGIAGPGGATVELGAIAKGDPGPQASPDFRTETLGGPLPS